MPNANRDKGLKSERDVAAYCRAHGMPKAERRVAAGWDAGHRSDADLGDIKGIPGVCLQVKNVSGKYPRGLAGKALDELLIMTAMQTTASGAALGLLIEKRAGHASPGDWWVHVPAHMFAALIFGIDPFSPPWDAYTPAIRIEFRHIVKHVAEFSAMCATPEGVAS